MRLTPAAAASGLLAGLLFWAPLPFASVTPAGRLTLTVGGILTLLLACFADRAKPLRRVAPTALALALLAAWGLVQATALPPRMIEWLSPEAAEIQDEAGLVVSDGGVARTLSLAPGATRDTALWWLALAATLAAAALVGRERVSRRVLAGSVLAAAAFQALYGARRWAAGAESIWGVEVPGSGARLRGTFVNSDHLAYFLELALALAFAWLWWGLRRARRDSRPPEQRFLLVASPLLVWLSLFTCLAFTGSRAGLAAALTATVVQGAIVAAGRRRWPWLPVGAAVGLLGLGVVAATGLQQGLGRWLSTSAYEIGWNIRLDVYAATLELWQRFPLTGTGLGSFGSAFPLVRPASTPQFWNHAHNDWLELLVTAGLGAFLVLLLALLLLTRRLWAVFRAQSRSEDRAAGLAALGALAAIAFHSLMDFGLAMPANAFALAVIVGAAAGLPAPPPGGRLSGPVRLGPRPLQGEGTAEVRERSPRSES